MTRTRPVLAIGYVLFLTASVSRASPPAVVSAAPLPSWNAKFAGKEGWIGGDAVYSVVLGKDRVLWLFGDTLLGSVKDGARKAAVMVNNTVGVQSRSDKDAPIRFVAGKGRDGKPAAVFTPTEGKGWFWPLAAVRTGDRLFVFLPRIEKTKEPGAFGFKHVGQSLAVVANPEDDPQKWRVRQKQIPFVEFGPQRERSWGSALLEDGNFLYVYGIAEERGKGIGKKRLIVARVPTGKLDDFGAWRFRTASGWSEKPQESCAAGRWSGDGVLGQPRSGRVRFRGGVHGKRHRGAHRRPLRRLPDGPWSAPRLLYRCPEMGHDKGVFTYSAKAHPWAAAGNELVIQLLRQLVRVRPIVPR